MHPTPPPPQERGTKISHANTAKLALQHGDRGLSNVCTAIANDEARHESEDGGGAAGHAHARGRHASTTNPSRLLAAAYKEIVGKLFESDPEGTLMAFSDMMKKGIVMPAHLVDDGWHAQANGGSANLFSDYAMVAERTGVYTAIDYASIVDHLVRAQGGGGSSKHRSAAANQSSLATQVKRWDIAGMRVGNCGGAAEAQDFLCNHAERIKRLANLQMERNERNRKAKTVSFSWINKRSVVLQWRP